MKKGQWFQKILQCLIVATGSYILYRGSGILAETGWLNDFFRSDQTVKAMRDTAVGLYFPGYVTDWQESLENDWLHSWMEELMPVLQEWYEQAKRQQERGETENGENASEGGGKTDTEKDEGAKPKEEGEAETQQEGEGDTEERKTETEEEPETQEENKMGSEEETGAEGEDEAGSEEETGTEGEDEVGSEEEAGAEGEDEAGSEEETVTEAERETGTTEETGTGEEQETEPAEEGVTEAETGEETEVREALAFSQEKLEQLQDFDYLLNHYFVVDADTVTDAAQLNAGAFLETDLSIEKNPEVPQILIYHTHSQEAFLDSVEGDESTTIIGMGDYLAELLEETYGYQVIHDTGVYDLVDGVLDRSAAYDYARASVEQILEEYPTIEVVIDLHRDGVEGAHFVSEEQGKPTAKIMFFNGLSKDSGGRPLDYLYNPYIEENLAFSFQLQLAAEQYYPGFTRNIYLKGQRFNLHLRPRSLLVEAGTQLNTVEEEKNAMEPLADILNEVLSGNTRVP